RSEAHSVYRIRTLRGAYQADEAESLGDHRQLVRGLTLPFGEQRHVEERGGDLREPARDFLAVLGSEHHAGPERRRAELPLERARESHLGEEFLTLVVVELSPDDDGDLFAGDFLDLPDEIGDQVGRARRGLDVTHARSV